MTPADILLRPARADDAAALAALATELGYSSTPEEMTARLALVAERPLHAVIVAEADGRVAGWLHVAAEFHLESGEFGEIAGLVVDGRLRGRGVGKLLLAAGEAWARERGLRQLRVRSNVIRSGAHAFYESAAYALRKQQKVFEKRL